MGKLSGSPQIPRLVLLLMLCAGVVVAQGQEHEVLRTFKKQIAQRTETLDSIKAELARGRRKVSELRKKEQSSEAVLRQLTDNVRLAERYLENVQSGIDSLDERIGELEVSLVAQQGQLQIRVGAMKRRLVSMYKASSVIPLGLFQNWGSPIEMLQRAFYFRRLKQYDAHLVSSIRAVKTRIESDKSVLEAALGQQQDLLAEKTQEQARLVAEKKSRETMLTGIRSEREAYEEQVADLQAAQRQLLELIKKLESRKAAAAADLERSLSSKFAKRKGRLPWPATGSVVKNFGRVVHPVYKTVTMNNGIDIQLSAVTPVRCVARGTVAYIGRMRGLGRFIMVDHYGGYLTIYANMGSIRVAQDDKVEYGSTLGASAPPDATGQSRLHFEVRKSTKALDPIEWLEAGPQG